MANELAVIRREPETAIAVSKTYDLGELQQLGSVLAKSGYFADAREAAQACVKVMAGQELGIPPLAAMMGVNIIKGKVTLGGNLIASRIRAHGYEYRHKQFDAKGCVLEFLSKPDATGKRSILGESSFTEEDAKAAQVFSDMYKKYPRNMYFNRAISNGAKWYTPEVFSGMPVYVPEELGAKVDGEGQMIHEPPTPEEIGQRRVEEERAKAAEAPKPKTDTAKPFDFKQMVEAFQFLKGEMEQYGEAGRKRYYSILGAHGVEHANELKSAVAAKACYKDMAQARRDLIEAHPTVGEQADGTFAVENPDA